MTTFAELKRQVFLKVNSSDGRAMLAVEQAINDAQKIIASVQDFDELMVQDTTHAVTVISKKSYHIETDLLLVRPKDIYSVRLMDTSNSRKLTYVSFRELDKVVPYTEQTGTGKSSFYTTRGKYVELYRIPDAIYSLYIMHSQWPDVLDADSEVTPFDNLDHVIVDLATDIATAAIEGGGGGSWFQRAQQLLGVALAEEETTPDQVLVAKPFNPYESRISGEYWLDPWVKHQPE